MAPSGTDFGPTVPGRDRIENTTDPCPRPIPGEDGNVPIVLPNPGVMAGGQAGGSHLQRLVEQKAELDVTIAHGARRRSAAQSIFRDKVVHDRCFEPLVYIHDMVRDGKKVRHTPRVADVFIGTARRVFRPHPGRQADDVVSFSLEQGGRHRAVDAAAHRHCDSLFHAMASTTEDTESNRGSAVWVHSPASALSVVYFPLCTRA